MKRPSLDKNPTYPGVGSYSIRTSISEGPGILMHARTDTVDQIVKKNIPGPGNYDIQNSQDGKHETSPKFRIGTSQRPALGGTRE